MSHPLLAGADQGASTMRDMRAAYLVHVVMPTMFHIMNRIIEY